MSENIAELVVTVFGPFVSLIIGVVLVTIVVFALLSVVFNLLLREDS